jgi:hypothetical protein
MIPTPPLLGPGPRTHLDGRVSGGNRVDSGILASFVWFQWRSRARSSFNTSGKIYLPLPASFLRFQIAKIPRITIAIAVRPTTRKTPATAPLFLKKLFGRSKAIVSHRYYESSVAPVGFRHSLVLRAVVSGRQNASRVDDNLTNGRRLPVGPSCDEHSREEFRYGRDSASRWIGGCKSDRLSEGERIAR